ncbi:Hypothetical protein PHPALM_6741 [Phytophthora palmivora]|uniref:Uncharacterized protein n=1 Tax=Phytophthora palmivora TaxID=4796 RepID=A0A2P4YE42_9STRA|nr:Hypothetical protein PHPALM_6741 [Phytophthora palmivora]
MCKSETHIGVEVAKDIFMMFRTRREPFVFKTVTKQAASTMAALNRSSGKWLVRTNERVFKTYGDTMAFIMLCEPYASVFASLLRFRTALEDFAHEFRNDPEFPSSLIVFSLPSFWRNLVDAERVIRSLSETSFRLQKNDNTMAEVVRCFGKIHSAVAASPYASYLVPVVGKRWTNCEQLLMLLAFCITFPIHPDSSGLTGDVDKWINGKFTPKKHTDFTDPRGIIQSDCVIQLWLHVGNSYYGKNSKLLHLAKVISVCRREYGYVELGLIITPRRIKINFGKARLITIVRNQKKPLGPTERQKQQLLEVSNPVTPLATLMEDVVEIGFMDTVKQ